MWKNVCDSPHECRSVILVSESRIIIISKLFFTAVPIHSSVHVCACVYVRACVRSCVCVCVCVSVSVVSVIVKRPVFPTSCGRRAL